jgi:SAM-dependent methyltransferase
VQRATDSGTLQQWRDSIEGEGVDGEPAERHKAKHSTYAEKGRGNTVAHMSRLSPRLAEIVNALPISPGMRVLEIGCGPGAAARAVAARLVTGHILAVDRSAKAIAQAEQQSAAEIASGRMSLRQVSAEELVLLPGEEPFDLAFAVRVGALDGRHPEAGREALARIAAVLRPGGRLFVDGGRPLREVPLPPVIEGS